MESNNVVNKKPPKAWMSKTMFIVLYLFYGVFYLILRCFNGVRIRRRNSGNEILVQDQSTLTDPDLSIQDSQFFCLNFVATQVFGIIIIILLSVWTAVYAGGLSNTTGCMSQNWHPFSMIVGLILFYGEGILIFRAFHQQRKTILKLFHNAVNLAAIMLAAFGMAVIIIRCNSQFTSLHSWIGLGTIIYLSLQFIIGFASFQYPRIGSNLFRNRLLRFHTFSGVAILGLSLLACITGLIERLSSIATTHEFLVGNFLGLFLILYTFLIICLVLNPSYKRKELQDELNQDLEAAST